MTKDKDFKKVVRARAARTGESYATARRNVAAKNTIAGDATVPETTWDVWCLRSTRGYSGRGFNPTGYEHHVATVRGDVGLIVRSDVAFVNYGEHRYRVESDATARRSRFESLSANGGCDAAAEGGAWRGTVRTGDEVTPFAMTIDHRGAHILPSIAARFLPVLLPFESGELAAYAPAPEDANHPWRPPGSTSWFPLLGAPNDPWTTKRTIVGSGEGAIRVGRTRLTAFRFDHVDHTGTVVATTWLDDTRNLVRYEATGLTIVAAAEDRAKAAFKPAS